VLAADVDVVAPCAVGGVMTEEVARSLRAWAVVGAANNVLASEEVARTLGARGALVVPDVIASAGAVIEGIGRTVMGLDDRAPLIDALGDTARTVLQRAERSGRTTTEVAAEMARASLEAARATASAARG
jgi:leucine dehydrogenase